MWFKQLLLTKNDCYTAGRKMTKIKGFMLHSTGANNPKLSRYVGPDDGNLGKNPYNNHWNQPGISKCVHAFIGLNKDGEVQTYQTLPWQHRGWHAGKNTGNNYYISAEICEGNLDDAVYFKKVYAEAVKLVTHLANHYKFTEADVIDHSEGYQMGIASNHGDVKHWFRRHGKTMDMFRADVKKGLTWNKKKEVEIPVTIKSTEDLAREVIAGKHGNGQERRQSLGDRYAEVQAMVSKMLKK